MKVYLEKKELEEALKMQKDKAGWTFFHERQFLENLLQTRFNFLIATYAIFFNTFFLCKGKEAKIIIAVVATIFIFFMFITILRIFIKVDALLSILYELNDKFTSKMLDKALGRCSDFLPNANRFIGIYIPAMLLITSVLGIFYSVINYLCKCVNICQF